MHHTIAISNFVRRQTHASQFSHWTHDDSTLRGLVSDNFCNAQPGYREGVILVPVPPQGFYSNVVKMKDGDILLGVYKPRKDGEEPRKQTFVLNGEKMPAVLVDVVLYRHDVLAEGDERSSDAEWEVISVNAEIDDATSPIRPGTLMANYFLDSGGTATGLSFGEFTKQLAESREYWKDKGDAAPVELVAVDQEDPICLVSAARAVNEAYWDLQCAGEEYQRALDWKKRHYPAESTPTSQMPSTD